MGSADRVLADLGDQRLCQCGAGLGAACFHCATDIRGNPGSAPTRPSGSGPGRGAARGFAHVGVIQVLEEAGLQPSHVVGTSAGSLVAALYASGKSVAELRKAAETMEEAEITDWMVPLLNRAPCAAMPWPNTSMPRLVGAISSR